MSSNSKSEQDPYEGTASDIDNDFEPTSDSEDSEIDESNTPNLKKQKGKKRLRRENQWRRNVRKKRLTAGEKHVNTKDVTVLEKRMGNPCNCKRKCFEKVRAEIRNKIFTAFYNMPSKDLQDSYLCGNISVKKVLRHRKRTVQHNKPKSVYCEFMVSNIARLHC